MAHLLEEERVLVATPEEQSFFGLNSSSAEDITPPHTAAESVNEVCEFQELTNQITPWVPPDQPTNSEEFNQSQKHASAVQ